MLTTPTDIWAFRYPLENELFALSRGVGGASTTEGMTARGSHMRATAEQLSARPSVVIASERMDSDPGWRLMASGELLHARADLSTTSSSLLPSRG